MILAARSFYCSGSDLVLSGSSNNGWNDGVDSPVGTYPSHSNESANKHRKLHSWIHREFPFALNGHILCLTWKFVSS